MDQHLALARGAATLTPGAMH
ncbi:hypothetical protein A2U01_0063302, partial [Trifolium medium]|nr:hypothetical protein [Trifolium medium]